MGRRWVGQLSSECPAAGLAFRLDVRKHFCSDRVVMHSTAAQGLGGSPSRDVPEPQGCGTEGCSDEYGGVGWAWGSEGAFPALMMP